eukprot:CAMPEP_0178645746 /NCGR_PEP_ID=MMETSP0698-20121128/18995_1 /TAXON_ID=265572 /ORGANISM="Extubocellulus spinifer, Strain CCMP396" /LENGTH=608 /DNA_ID=CAMNT_0020286835 /DNA_START=33 /DNA_END=1859 /DNA_ORIENTATION=+
MRARAFSSGDTRQEDAGLNVSWSQDVFGGTGTSDGEKENDLALSSSRAADSDPSCTISDDDDAAKPIGGRNEANSAASASASESASLYTTEIVRALFGPTIGSVIGDYSCSYKRNSGRLYLANNAMCFYSNLFGSESKYILRLPEITRVSKIKNSGICVKDSAGLDHKFRSFNDRDVVYDIIGRLHSARAGSSNNSASESRSDNRSSSSVGAFGAGAMAPSAQAASFVGLALADTDALRTPYSDESGAIASRGGTSVTDRRLLKSFSTLTDASQSMKWPKTRRNNQRRKKNHRRLRSKSVDTFDRISMSAFDTAESESTSSELEVLSEEEQHHLDEMIESPLVAEGPARIWSALTEKKLKETALDNVHLSCSLDSFHDKFIRDGAPFAFGKFQTSRIGDFELEVESWAECGEHGSNKRVIKFRHPLKHKLGPSSAAMEKHQFCTFIRGHGLLLKSCTYGKGFPAADAFHVEDMWIIEPSDSGGVTMAVLFQVHYSKSTMLKKLIDSNTRQEYTTMYTKYLEMVASALGEKKAESTEAVSVEEDNASLAVTEAVSAPARTPFLQYHAIIISLVVVAMAYYIAMLRSRVQYLEEQMDGMKQAFSQIQAAE